MLVNKSRGRGDSKPILIFFQPTRKWIFRTPSGRGSKWLSKDSFNIMIKRLKEECRGKFDRPSSTWSFDDFFLGSVKIVLTDYFGRGGFIVKEFPRQQQQSISNDPEPFSIFRQITGEDISSLDREIAKKIYRKWVVKLHPDLGGDHEKMAELNRAWNLIKQGAKPQEQEVDSFVADSF